eukprot:Selendium_serpulae@DN6267_c3_g1_i10.p3
MLCHFVVPWLQWPRPAQPRSQPIHAGAVRVEPKAFFANERTLLQWMNVAVLISTIGITLLNFGSRIGRVGGLLLSPVAIFFIVYSFVVYLRRNRKLERKEVVGYNDQVGPAVLVVCLVVSLSTVLILNIMEHSTHGAPVPVNGGGGGVVPGPGTPTTAVPPMTGTDGWNNWAGWASPSPAMS